jgi:CelD/BcsL family acetyltransferase involved in cellulose biosynthesis
MLDAAGLRALPAAAWDELAAAALVENPFYARRHVLAGLNTIERGTAVSALVVRGDGGSLLGLFPFHRRGKVPAPFAVAFGATNRYQFCGTPLVHADHAAAVVEAWMAAIAAGRPRGIWALPDIDTGTPLLALVAEAARRRGLTTATANPYSRASLTRLPGGLESHLSSVLSKNRLKDVRRTMRRLSEVGTVSLEHADAGPLLEQRLSQFLALEHAGWKGGERTSYLSRPEDAEFARRAYGDALAAIDSLVLDGEPIAMKLSIRTGPTAFTPKITYDERHRKLGPGMALEYLLIEEFYRSGDPVAVDAAATAEGHSALNFFNAEKAMATLVVGRRGWQVRLLAWLFGTRERLKTRLKAGLFRRTTKAAAP